MISSQIPRGAILKILWASVIHKNGERGGTDRFLAKAVDKAQIARHRLAYGPQRTILPNKGGDNLGRIKISSILGVVAFVTLITSVSAFADCITDNYGQAHCGAGACIIDNYGHGLCATAPGGQCIVDNYGYAHCGAGQCIVDNYGHGVCSPYYGGQCTIDNYGHGVCQ